MFYKNIFLPSIFIIILGLVGIQTEIEAQDLQQDRQDQDEQTELSGEIRDAESDEPLSNIEVVLEREDFDEEGFRERDPDYTPEDDAERTPEAREEGREKMHHGGKKTAITDENGQFSIEDLEEGEYNLRVEEEGYEETEETVDLSQGETEEVEIRVQPEDGGNGFNY